MADSMKKENILTLGHTTHFRRCILSYISTHDFRSILRFLLYILYLVLSCLFELFIYGNNTNF